MNSDRGQVDYSISIKLLRGSPYVVATLRVALHAPETPDGMVVHEADGGKARKSISSFGS